ncbi:hypothetical protein HXX76_012637 [Chlamydomonas incerta]|uniref:LysM domain-containing protein n=1 Tax=Chlamydomonas incerta TaxID=51695 RepID=A0A835SLC4_CHLIN|nr:hypothetical protein HXX76_012637 [Chlamydomonas incerta]|eukprot:KAG2427127.1 hypothetical protein HXX76_012637 [Chlamydomonas incerta]
MGQGRSRHVYAFQPLPWPESLHAFRLIDQICGIATTYATTHLEGHAVRVLDKIGELQRLPFQWEVFEPDFERLRGSHLIALATELHSALDKLEGCKYDMGMLAEKGLMFKSLRKAADKVLVLLTEVEQIHRAFHYAFELALYESVRDETPAPPGTLRANSPARSTLRTPISGGGARSIGSSGGGARGMSSGGRRQPVLLPPPPPPPEPEDSDLYSQTATTSPRPQRQQSAQRQLPPRTSPSVRQPQLSTPAAAAAPLPPLPAMAEQRQAMAAVAPPPVVAQRSVRIMNDAATSTPTHMAQEQQQSAAAFAAGNGATARAPAMARAQSYKTPPPPPQQQPQPQQQYVVVYLPQGPGSSGPRAILVPSEALQPAPNSPAPSSGGAPPPSSQYSPLPTLRSGSLGSTAYTGAGSPYSPYAPPPHMPTAAAVAGYGSRGAAGYGSPYQAPPQHAYNAPAAGSAYGPRQPLFGSPGSTGSPYTTTSAYPTSGPYGHTAMSRPGSPPAYKYFSPPSSPPSPGLSYVTSPPPYATSAPPPPQYNPYAAPRSPATSSMYGSPVPPPPPPPSTATAGFGMGMGATAMPAVVPGAAPGSVMVLQPVSATMTSSGAVVLQPTMAAPGDVAAPPMLVVAQDPDSMSAGGGSSGRQRSVRFSRTYDDDEEEHEYDRRDDRDMEEPRGSGGGGGGSGGRRHHSTYTYVPGRNASPYQAPSAVPSYLTPYFGELSPRPMEDAGAGYGGGPEDWEGEEERAAAQGARARLRSGGGAGRASGGGAASLMSKYRDLWSAPPGAPVPGPQQAAAGRGQQQAYLVDAYAGGGTTAHAAAAARPQSRTASPRRESELMLGGGLDAAAAGVAAPPALAAHNISYERLAALAGLDPEVLGAGAAAGLTERRRSGGAIAATAVKPYVVPGEEALRKMEGLLAAAEDGDWDAVADMAALIRAGWWGDGRDAAVARGLLLQAALRGGSVEAHAALGDMAERGEGLPGGLPDQAGAARHYAAAAAGGHRDAATAYAYLLEHGLGVAQDEPRAAQMYAAAAQRGCPTGANNLAKMILDGRGGIMQVPGAATSGRSRRRLGADGVSAAAPAAPTPVGMAMALFRRAADAGSASAWYNLGVCHLQQIKQQQASLKKLGLSGGNGRGGREGGGGEATPVLLGAKDESGMAEAIRCLTEAASRGHARAALRAGHLHLLRSAAAAAVDAFSTAAINAAATMAAAAGGGGGSHGAAAVEEADGAVAASPAAADAAEVEAEALWCLAQLAERQSAVLEGRAAVALAAANAPGSAAGSEGTGGGRPSGDGGTASRMDSVRSRGLQASTSGNSRHSGGTHASGAGGVARANEEVAAGADDDVAVGQLLATLAGTGPGGDAAAAAAAATAIAGSDAISDDMAAAAAADPAAAAALRFAKELCRLDFDCCRQLGAVRNGGALTAAAAAAAGLDPAGVPPAQRVRGLRRLRRQAREVVAEAAAPGVMAAAVSDSGGDGESRSSVDGGGGSAAGLPSAGHVSAALARLDLQLQQPGERATRSRRAAAELMAAAAARGHAGAQHWLAGWQWSMGHTGGAAALWQAAAARGHGPSLMVLGQMAEAGHVMAAAAAGTSAGGAAGQQLQTAGRGADLAAAARYYLRAQEAGAAGALEAMRRVQRVLQRHVALQGRLEAVAVMGGPGAAGGRAAEAGGVPPASYPPSYGLAASPPYGTYGYGGYGHYGHYTSSHGAPPPYYSTPAAGSAGGAGPPRPPPPPYGGGYGGLYDAPPGEPPRPSAPSLPPPWPPTQALVLEGVLLSTLSDRGAVNQTTIVPIRVASATVLEALRAAGLSTGSGAASPPPPPLPPPLPPGALPGLSGRRKVLAVVVSMGKCGNGTAYPPGGTFEYVRTQLKTAAETLSNCSRGSFSVEFSVVALQLSCDSDIDRRLFSGACDEVRIAQRLSDVLQQQQLGNGTSSSNTSSALLGSGAYGRLGGGSSNPAAGLAARVFVLPVGVGAICGWRGMALPDQQIVLLPSEDARGLKLPWVIVHELLHVIAKLQHAGASSALVADTDREDDPTSPMGCGGGSGNPMCPADGNVCPNAPQMRYLGWAGLLADWGSLDLPAGQSQFITLPAQDDTSTPKDRLLIRIRPDWLQAGGTDGTDRYTHNLYISYRRPQGPDSALLTTLSAGEGRVVIHQITTMYDTAFGSSDSTGGYWYTGYLRQQPPNAISIIYAAKLVVRTFGSGGVASGAIGMTPATGSGGSSQGSSAYSGGSASTAGASGVCQCPSPYTVVPDDTLYKVAVKCGGGLTINSLVEANRLDNPGNICFCLSPYTVQKGDSLWIIVNNCGGGLSQEAIVSANHIANINLLTIGQRLILPGCSSAPDSGSADGVASGGGVRGLRRRLAAAAPPAEESAAPPPMDYTNPAVDTTPRNITVQICRYNADPNRECPPPPRSPPPPPPTPRPPRKP